MLKPEILKKIYEQNVVDHLNDTHQTVLFHCITSIDEEGNFIFNQLNKSKELDLSQATLSNIINNLVKLNFIESKGKKVFSIKPLADQLNVQINDANENNYLAEENVRLKDTIAEYQNFIETIYIAFENLASSISNVSLEQYLNLQTTN